MNVYAVKTIANRASGVMMSFTSESDGRKSETLDRSAVVGTHENCEPIVPSDSPSCTNQNCPQDDIIQSCNDYSTVPTALCGDLLQ